MRKTWIPIFFILLLSAGAIWMVTREPPPEIPKFPTITGKIQGIDYVTLFAFLPVSDQRRVSLFLDFQKAEYGGLSGGFKIYFFNDFHNTPTTYPLTEKQMKHLCAKYSYNKKNGLDQLSWKIPPGQR